MQAENLPSAIDPAWLPWLGAGLAVVLLAATLEGLVMSWRRPGSYDWGAYFATLGDAVGRRLVEALGLSLALPVMWWAHEHRLTTIDLDSTTAIAALFVGEEFCYYVHHRCAHRVRWFWATHCVHHSPNQLTWAAAMRLGWTGRISGTVLFFVPLVWIGFSPLAVLGALAANLLYQFWLHATWIPKLGPLEWVLNTPSHHRVHHACNPEYIDCNYGGVVIVFDRLFGTFVAERDDLAPRYGLTEPLHSCNPLRIALHEWVRLGRDLMAARSLPHALRTLFGPPGDRPAARLAPAPLPTQPGATRA